MLTVVWPWLKVHEAEYHEYSLRLSMNSGSESLATCSLTLLLSSSSLSPVWQSVHSSAYLDRLSVGVHCSDLSSYHRLKWSLPLLAVQLTSFQCHVKIHVRNIHIKMSVTNKV